MFFRYWKEDGKATVIENVDRLVFDSCVKLQYRTCKENRFDWNSLKFGIDYLQFTMSKD